MNYNASLQAGKPASWQAGQLTKEGLMGEKWYDGLGEVYTPTEREKRRRMKAKHRAEFERHLVVLAVVFLCLASYLLGTLR